MKQKIVEPCLQEAQHDQEQVPRYFYRYRSLAEKSSKYVERIICHNELFFASPSTFNDPFDCRPPMDFQASRKEYTDLAIRNLKGRYPSWSQTRLRKEAEAMFKDWLDKKQRPIAERRMYQKYGDVINGAAGVLCLSTTSENILMWSHYANSHRGICLQFDGMDRYFARAQIVGYSNHRPAINPFRQNKDEILNTAILTKSDQWNYEQEWRIVDHEKGEGEQTFPPELLKGVILGARISSKDEQKVRSWIARRQLPVDLFQATICEHTFSVYIDPVN